MSIVSRPVAVRLALVALVATTAGCAFDSPIVVRFSGASPVQVTESLWLIVVNPAASVMVI